MLKTPVRWLLVGCLATCSLAQPMDIVQAVHPRAEQARKCYESSLSLCKEQFAGNVVEFYIEGPKGKQLCAVD